MRVLAVGTFATLVACEGNSQKGPDEHPPFIVKVSPYPIPMGPGGGDWPRLPVYGPIGGHAPGGIGLPSPEPYVGGDPPIVPVLPVWEVPEGEWIDGKATHYGESYNGSPLGCGTGTYDSTNSDIVAVSPSRYGGWPCGTMFQVCGGRGCIVATRHDGCPGCTANHLDLSEAGITAVCGGLGTCQIRFRVVP